MSAAAEQANPTPPLNISGDAAVIDLMRRRDRRDATAKAKGRGMTTDPRTVGTDRPTAPARTPLELFADDIETAFNAIDTSLTHPPTQAVFRRTLDIWQGILEGSHAKDLITTEQLADFQVILGHMRDAPRHV